MVVLLGFPRFECLLDHKLHEHQLLVNKILAGKAR